ncbi:MAG: hypothetical protein ACYDDZ_03740, partial [Acidimicrobiales bacterium]
AVNLAPVVVVGDGAGELVAPAVLGNIPTMTAVTATTINPHRRAPRRSLELPARPHHSESRAGRPQAACAVVACAVVACAVIARAVGVMATPPPARRSRPSSFPGGLARPHREPTLQS